MARKTRTKTQARRPLSRERVLRAALEFVDERGLEELSMRKLAQELGVEAMSLYNHVANKDEILAGIVDLVATEIEMPDGDDWKAAIRESAAAASPWLPVITSTRFSLGRRSTSSRGTSTPSLGSR